MKIGEIKLESLRLMGVNEEELEIEKLEDYKIDERYKDYLERMNGAINRAISRFTVYKVLPTKIIDVKPSQGETIGQHIKFNLKKIVSDFNSLERILYIYERVVPNINYETIVDGEILIPYCSSYNFKGMAKNYPDRARCGDAYNVEGVCKFWNGQKWEELEEDETFKMEYISKIIVSNNDNEELDVHEALARMIPYYVKAELFEFDEPNLSANARNIFESALTEYVSFGMPKRQRQQYVENTFL